MARAMPGPAVRRVRTAGQRRDVDVLVAPGTQVELSGRTLRGDLRNDVPAVEPGRREHVIRIRGRTVLGDVTVRVAPAR